MTGEKVREVLAVYRQRFEELKISKMKCSPDICPSSHRACLAHCHAMLEEMEVFIQQDRMKEVFRWLGFIQGCLWRAGVYTLEDLKNHSRP